MDTKQCQATLDYSGIIPASNTVEAVALKFLDDKPLYLTQYNLQEYVLTGLYMSIAWFVCFFTLFFLIALIFSRNKWLEKPNRVDVRQTPLYEPRT